MSEGLKIECFRCGNKFKVFCEYHPESAKAGLAKACFGWDVHATSKYCLGCRDIVRLEERR